MVKIKAIDQQYTMKEISDIAETLYPFGEYYPQEHKGTRKELSIEDGKLVVQDTGEKVTYQTIETNIKYCEKEDLINLFFTLNKCNKKLAFSGVPLTAREKKKLMEERAEAYKQLQEKTQPQPIEEKEQLIHPTDEAIKELKQYFLTAFYGVGNNNPDYFNNFLIPAFKMCQTKKAIANLLLACYNGDKMMKQKKPKSWNKWVEVVCRLFSIDRLPYKPGELGEPDYNFYYWLKTQEKKPGDTKY